MILYFDSLITDVPLKAGLYSDLDALRDSCDSYRKRSRLDVTKYTLASYATVKWSKVVVKYELQPDSPAGREDFESFVRSLFPSPTIAYGRSDSCAKFRDAVERLVSPGPDDWTFYAGNNDHPIVASDMGLLEKCLAKARLHSSGGELVSVVYSHAPEYVNYLKPDNILGILAKGSFETLEEDGDLAAVRMRACPFEAIQIVNRPLLDKWFRSVELPGVAVKRSDDLYGRVEPFSATVVIPKREICRHYDGYTHHKEMGYTLIPYSHCPPLFIPDGFFNGEIRFRYGYEDRKEGWVNSNPCLPYAFEIPGGADLKIRPEEMPLFWRSRVKEIDVNPKLDSEKMEIAWRAQSQKISELNFPLKGSKLKFNLALRSLKTLFLRLPLAGSAVASLKRRTGRSSLIPFWR